jgi:hypothetical protein
MIVVRAFVDDGIGGDSTLKNGSRIIARRTRQRARKKNSMAMSIKKP